MRPASWPRVEANWARRSSTRRANMAFPMEQNPGLAEGPVPCRTRRSDSQGALPRRGDGAGLYSAGFGPSRAPVQACGRSPAATQTAAAPYPAMRTSSLEALRRGDLAGARELKLAGGLTEISRRDLRFGLDAGGARSERRRLDAPARRHGAPGQAGGAVLLGQSVRAPTPLDRRLRSAEPGRFSGRPGWSRFRPKPCPPRSDGSP